MAPYFAYIRVSTPKQGVKGVSLHEQRDAISQFAEQNGYRIARWFEERETAAKRGRAVFGEMMKLLRRGKAEGVILHKLDRGARNLKDWADLGELIDGGVDVRFAFEDLDLRSRGGRLAADVQAVVAADHIRNLRAEVLKGFYGRLKQGLYPLPAPVGYRNMGGGKAKELDEVRAPLVRQMFELYATGTYGLRGLVKEMNRRGLRTIAGKRIMVSHAAIILKNTFYIGLISLKRTGQTFSGVHEPLVSKRIFDQVQALLRGKAVKKIYKHDFLFRRLVRCKECGYSLVGERQKGHIYYRCHSYSCRPASSFREERFEEAILGMLEAISLSPLELSFLSQLRESTQSTFQQEVDAQRRAQELNLQQIEARQNRLTDALLDGVIDKIVYEQRNTALLLQRKDAVENLSRLEGGSLTNIEKALKYLEVAADAKNAYISGIYENKREIISVVTSNRFVCSNSLEFGYSIAFQEVANYRNLSNGALQRNSPRTIQTLLDRLVEVFKANDDTCAEAI